MAEDLLVRNVVKRAVRRLAIEMDEFARTRGWSPDQMKAYFRPNTDWGKMSVIVVGPFAADDEGRHRDWQELHAFLRDHLEDEPELYRAVGLVLRTPKEVREGGLYAISPAYAEADEF